MPKRKARIIILCKTYPTPSNKYGEVCCVAGIDMETGELLRLFPLPFRMLADDKKFKKWQPIEALIEKAKEDRRPESHRIFTDTISILGDPLPTSDQWKERRRWLNKLPVFTGPRDLEDGRKSKGITLGLIRPARILEFRIELEKNSSWSKEEMDKLLKSQLQFGLFDADEERKNLMTLEKLPFRGYYIFKCIDREGEYQARHMVTDWELGALYIRMKSKHGPLWEKKLQKKFGDELPSRDLFFLMGTVHRFPDQWLIVSVIYPPRERQQSLFD